MVELWSPFLPVGLWVTNFVYSYSFRKAISSVNTIYQNKSPQLGKSVEFSENWCSKALTSVPVEWHLAQQKATGCWNIREQAWLVRMTVVFVVTVFVKRPSQDRLGRLWMNDAVSFVQTGSLRFGDGGLLF